MSEITITTAITPEQSISDLTMDFLKDFTPLEILSGGKALLMLDEKSRAYYIPCHIKATDFVGKADFNATIDGNDDDELYKLNRDITENEGAFATMIADAKAGRTFEDVVVEFDKSYSSELPLKIYGGQHRIRAIQSAKDYKPNTYHGFRIYFGLTKEQRAEGRNRHYK